MKKIIMALLICILVFMTAACGVEDKPVAEKYYKLMDQKEGTYYMETDVSEQFLDDPTDNQIMTSIAAEAIDGDKSIYLQGQETFTERQLTTGDKQYVINDQEKTYAVTKKADEQVEDKQEYVKSGDTTLNGKNCSYDQYQSEYTMEGQDGSEETHLFITRYLVDDNGELIGLRFYNQLKEGDKPFYRRTDVVTKFEEGKVPEGIFDLPQGYKKVEQQ